MLSSDNNILINILRKKFDLEDSARFLYTHLINCHLSSKYCKKIIKARDNINPYMMKKSNFNQFFLDTTNGLSNRKFYNIFQNEKQSLNSEIIPPKHSRFGSGMYFDLHEKLNHLIPSKEKISNLNIYDILTLNLVLSDFYFEDISNVHNASEIGLYINHQLTDVQKQVIKSLSMSNIDFSNKFLKKHRALSNLNNFNITVKVEIV